MSRCLCCDWSHEGVQSDFNRGLILGRRPKKLVETHDGLVCDVCRDTIYDDYVDDLVDPEEEMEKYHG